MQRVHWRTVRKGHEAEDRRHNENLASRILAADAIDDVAIALDQIGFMIVPQDGRAEKWPMVSRLMLTPRWAASVPEQERDVRRCLAEMHPTPVTEVK
jgi:hypothetical protein